MFLPRRDIAFGGILVLIWWLGHLAHSVGCLTAEPEVQGLISGPKVIKKISLSMEFFLLINVKMPTIVGILTFYEQEK